MSEMKNTDYYAIGIGLLFSAGFLTYLQSAQGISFGFLPIILVVLGMIFIKHGFALSRHKL